jgi:hypothetical protein
MIATRYCNTGQGTCSLIASALTQHQEDVSKQNVVAQHSKYRVVSSKTVGGGFCCCD